METQQRLVAAEERLILLEEAGSELDKLRKDQEDLLELLTDQDIRLSRYKERLRTLGEKVIFIPLFCIVVMFSSITNLIIF